MNHAPTNHAPTNHAPTNHAPTNYAPTNYAETFNSLLFLGRNVISTSKNSTYCEILLDEVWSTACNRGWEYGGLVPF